MRGPKTGFRSSVVIVTLAVAAACVSFFGMLSLGGRLSFDEDYHVKAVVPTSASLAPGARITMAGVEVGQVESIERKGLGVVLDLRIDQDDVAPVPRDSRVSIRQRTPVGENYVSIEPGRSGESLPSGDPLPASSADDYVDLDQILSAFRGRTRQRMRALIQGLGQGVEGRGPELNAMLSGSAGVLEEGGRIALVFARSRRRVARLVENFGSVADAVGERGTAVRNLARYGLESFRAVGERDEALRSTLREVPPTLARVRTTTDTLRSTTGELEPVVSDLAVVVEGLRPAVDLLRPAAGEGRQVLRALVAAAPRLETTLGLLRRFSPRAESALPELGDVLCEVNPALSYAAPYTAEIAGFFSGYGSAANAYDALGHTIRVNLVVNEGALVGLPPQVSEAAFTLLHSGLLEESHGSGFNAYPAPGRAGNNDGMGVIGPTRVRTPYTRVHNCRGERTSQGG